MEVRGTSTLITGGSRGLGAALGRELAGKGARVVLVARHEAPLIEVVEEIRANGGEAHALTADIADKQAIYRLAGAAQALIGPIDLLVHNASALGPVPLRALADTECEELEQVLAANLLGPFRLTKALLGEMALRHRGLIVHITSDAGVVPYPSWGAYGVSKAALDQLARIWAVECEAFGVRFLSLDPGEMDTRMHADAVPDADRTTLRDPARVAAEVVRMIESAATDQRLGARLEVIT
jgi:NAD(P)-dependent dehydrogenase (short-subunit alcohol dehydrogenase family)